jgi:hypothetical protein
MKTTIKKSNDKPKNIISDNINEEIEKVMNKKKFETIQYYM